MLCRSWFILGGSLVLLLGVPAFASAGIRSASTAADQTGRTCASQAATTYRLIKEPQAGYRPIYQFISAARHTLDMTMYSLVDPKATAALSAAAERGVTVRVLLDSSSNGGAGGRATNAPAYKTLRAHGVNVRWSWSGVLWHQKSIVRDGRAVCIMTGNLYAPYYSVLRDFAVVADNAATVAGVEATLQTDFTHNHRPPAKGVVPRGSELIWSPGAQDRLVKLIGTARPGSTLFAEDEQLASPAIEQALVAAAKRGVTANLTMTASSDWQAGFDTLVAGGVHVNLYPANAPLYIQSKGLSVNASPESVQAQRHRHEVRLQGLGPGGCGSARSVA